MSVPPVVRLVLAWVACVAVAGWRLNHAWTEFDADPDTPADEVRGDGNHGHTLIDFGGQWMMGRMVVTGQGRQLYHRAGHWPVVREGFPRAAEAPKTQRLAFPDSLRPSGLKGDLWRHDAEGLMQSTMGTDSPRWTELGTAVALPFAAAGPLDGAALQLVAEGHATPELVADLQKPRLGGALYPPVQAVLYSPLGLLSPQRAYRVTQLLSINCAFLCGGFVWVITRGRVWAPVATAAILLFPGCRAGLDLGQNHLFTLAIVLGGWSLAARNRDFAGGSVWGLLAFKPVWGLAFAVVPLVLGRWRFLLGLTVSGVALVLLTLPLVGVQSWLDWLAVGREASALYAVNEKWIHLSRDLSGVVRRPLLDFALAEEQRGSPLADQLSWALWAAVMLTTLAVHRLRRQAPEATGFLFLGAILCCYRFMYYDVVLAVAAVFALLANRPLRSMRFVVVMLALLYLCENWWIRLDVRATVGLAYLERPPAPGSTTPRFPVLTYASDYEHATDTLLMLVLWAGLAVGLLRQPRSASSAAPMSGDRISDSPTSTA